MDFLPKYSRFILSILLIFSQSEWWLMVISWMFSLQDLAQAEGGFVFNTQDPWEPFEKKNIGLAVQQQFNRISQRLLRVAMLF